MKTSKKLKKLTALFLVLVLALCMTVPAAATEQETDTSPSSTPTSSEGGDAGEGGDKNDAETPTGTGTVTIKNAGVGVTYNLYKLFDAAISDDTKDGTSNSILYSGTIPTGLTGYFETDGYDHIVAKKDALDSTDEKALDENGTLVDASTILSEDARSALKAWAEGQEPTATAIATATNTDDKSVTLVFEKLPFGYYVLTAEKDNGDEEDNTYDAIVVTSVNPDATIYDKNLLYPTTVDDKDLKYLTYPDRDANAAIGDTVSFTIAFKTKNVEGAQGSQDAKFVTSYVITDTPTGLKFDTNPENISITMTGDDGVEHTLTYDENINESYVFETYDGKATLYTYGLEERDNGKVVIRIPWAYKYGYTGAYNFMYGEYPDTFTIKIVYQATVTDEAADKGIKNQATVDWGVDGNKLSGDVDINTARFNLKKVNDKEVTLEGAEFNLQWTSTGLIDSVTSTVQLVEETDETGKIVAYRVATGKEITNGEATKTIVAGDVDIKGLDLDKDYQLVEVKAPDGYNKIDDPIPVTKLTEKQQMEEDAETDDTITEDDLAKASDTKYVKFKDVTVTNLTGSTLPSTGGIGTTIFYIVGGVLAVGALVLLITRKRVHLEHE
jgi:LPXTG-motif cell wall-anchored protein